MSTEISSDGTDWGLTDPAAVHHVAVAQDRARADGLWWTPQTTLLEVLNLARDEVTNCKMLAWALDPAGRHQVGAGLTQRLMAALGHDVEPVDCQRATVTTELSRLESRADIVISFPGRPPVVMEAKVAAPEGPDQCSRIERDWPDAVFVFLTPSGRPPTTTQSPGSWKPVSWSWFLDAVADALASEEGREMIGPRTAQAQQTLADWAQGARRTLT